MSLPLELPLRGSQLIEASAGTGKTFTIALLYVRLVLGHGQPDSEETARDNGFLRPLVPPEILVVTFTEAASMELKARIRERLVQAAEAFREAPDEADFASSDPLLALRNEYPPLTWPTCARRLQVAAEWMDDAAVSTIHSWAQKMLKEHAFDSGNLFNQELVSDLTDMTLEAVTDYWRTRVYPLEEKLAGAMVAIFGSPAGLLQRLRNPLQRQDAQLVFRGERIDTSAIHLQLTKAGDALESARKAPESALESYRADAERIRKIVTELRPAMNGSTFRGVNDDDVFADWLEELAAWGSGRPLDDCKFVQKLARSRFRLKKGETLPDLPMFDHLDAWCSANETLEQLQASLEPMVLADACGWVSERMERQLREHARMGYDDMIQGLDSALAGDNGESLTRRIREQFPVAMIDEFQDTDPSQYRIFDQIYHVEANSPDSALILIGDPKQAIYGFRGGDIYTYLRARRATQGRHHTLDTNFRSSQAMVGAANHLFAHAEEHTRGAFRFRADGDNPLPFQTVKANDRTERLILDDAPAPAVTGWLMEEPEAISKGDYLRVMAEHGAARIAQWLTQAQSGQAGFMRQGDDTLEPLKAGDIAILVRDRQEAAAIRNALSERNLPSVYLSDRDSVFACDEAKDVLRWLRACAAPEEDERVRAALATATLSLPLSELDRLQQDELAWERQQERFADYRQQWHRQGVLPTLRQLMHDFEVPQRLLAKDQGERRITNLLHLAEWAQQASDTLDGEHALIRLLAEHIDNPAGEEQILRLESDAQLIQVVTIFKSKGLEYPLVALPFVCTAKEINAYRSSALYHQGEAPILEMAKKKEAEEGYAQADDERLSEEMRLLYVALTRARYATFLGLAPLKFGGKKAALEKTALGYLLAGGQPIEHAASLKHLWLERCEACGALGSETVFDSASRERYAPPSDTLDWQGALAPTHAPFTAWWVASYSALQQKAAETPETPQAEIRSEETIVTTPRLKGNVAPMQGTLHAFPRGPEPGTFLHGVLESMAEAGFANATSDSTWQRRIERRCEYRGWAEHAPALIEWTSTMLASPLAATGQSGPILQELSHYWAEPDFWFATHQAQTPAIDRLIQRYIAPGRQRPTLGYHRLNGLMKGFIDLLAEHDGRYYVIDWKSNWLGADDSAYQPEAMIQAMLDKRYDVQLAIYLLALHRHLRDTLPDYDYQRDIGGGMLVFLRGIGAESRGVHLEKPPIEFITALDALMAGEVPTEQEAS